MSSADRFTSEQRMLQAYPQLAAFFEKYALGPKERPSCFVCGLTVEQWPPAIQHAELPGIVVCFLCRDSAQSLSALGAEQLMRLSADINDELERRYREAKREQNKRADELRRQPSSSGFGEQR